ncbi:hypothetical protein, partial [Magnetovibrio sp.]|uniref:hypothetical protein n=1 Tax=Magnetovibrio sp. TaxID=2024836 RepID=UPI002F9241A9
NAPEDEDAQDWNSGLLGEETSAPKATPAVDPDAVKNDKPAPAPKTKGGVPTPEEYNKNLATKTGWDRFVYGTKYGYLNNPTPASTAAKQKDPFARPSGQDLIRGRSIGYNDFLKGGLYGPYEGEPTTGPVNYAERRARWNAANPDIADSTFGNTSLGSGPGTKDTNNLGALTRKNVNPEGVVVDTELNTVFDADAQAAEKEHRQRMADAAKARQRTKYAAAWQRELDKPRALQKSPQQFAKDYQRSYGITSGYAPLGAEPVARGSAPQENVRNGLLMDLNELTKLIGPDSLAPQAKVPGVQVAFAPAITATPYATAALLEALALAGVLGLKAKRDAERRLLAEDDPLRDPAPGYGPPAQPEGWVETYPQASPDILRSTPPSVPGTPLTPNFEGYPDQSEELNKPQIVDARKDDLEKVDYLADHHDIDRAKLSDALHDLKDYYGYGGKSVHIDRNTLDVREKKGGRYIDNLENWIN